MIQLELINKLIMKKKKKKALKKEESLKNKIKLEIRELEIVIDKAGKEE